MTEPNEFELLELATPYGLDAVSEADRVDIERRVAAAPAAVAAAFHDEVRAVRETMAVVAAATTAEPPAALREAILAAAKPPEIKSQPFWRTKAFAAAAAVLIGLAGFGIGWLARPHPGPTVAQQIMQSPDMHSVSRPLGPGTATVMFSREHNAGVLVMDNVPPPSPGTVYQMWLLGDKGPTSAGTMDATAVQPTTLATIADLGSSTALAFTVEPGSGSSRPTTPILAQLPLR